METQVDLAAMLGLTVSKLNMIMSKWSETEIKRIVGHCFLKNPNLSRLYK
jgi:hypothetical protein